MTPADLPTWLEQEIGRLVEERDRLQAKVDRAYTLIHEAKSLRSGTLPFIQGASAVMDFVEELEAALRDEEEKQDG